VLICISAVCVGFGFGAYVPTGFARIPSLVSPAAATMAISIFAAGNSFGQFLNPYVVTSSATLINDSVGARFLISAVCLGIVFVINMIFEYKEAKQTPTATETES
jgi:MFS family permease